MDYERVNLFVKTTLWPKYAFTYIYVLCKYSLCSKQPVWTQIRTSEVRTRISICPTIISTIFKIEITNVSKAFRQTSLSDTCARW